MAEHDHSKFEKAGNDLENILEHSKFIPRIFQGAFYKFAGEDYRKDIEGDQLDDLADYIVDNLLQHLQIYVGSEGDPLINLPKRFQDDMLRLYFKITREDLKKTFKKVKKVGPELLGKFAENVMEAFQEKEQGNALAPFEDEDIEAGKTYLAKKAKEYGIVHDEEGLDNIRQVLERLVKYHQNDIYQKKKQMEAINHRR